VTPALATNSVRLRSSASAYLARTPASSGNRQTWTYSAWVKLGAAVGTSNYNILMARTGASYYTGIYFNANNLYLDWFNGSQIALLRSSQVFRDPSAWYHIVITIDSTNATASNRVLMYINGTRVTAFTTATYPSQNAQTAGINEGGVAHWISSDPAFSAQGYFDGYLTEINFIDGQALTPNYFGATSVATGAWQPATYRGTYGTNGFYLPMNKTVEDYSVDYLVVAGGGSGAAGGGGGGGAGGMLTGTTSLIQSAVYTITVGAGGAQTSSTFSQRGNSGSNSVLSSVTAIGGGGGGANDVTDQWDGLSGGSGGGGGSAGSIGVGGAGTSGQGNNGGVGGTDFASWRNGGGGGGKGAVGGAVITATVGGNGGNGGASSITGSSITYAGGGGGGGGGSGTGGTGGTGGGGSGTNGSATGVAGTANLGGGGGGGGYPAAGGAGGSGVVILRILTTQYSGVTTGSPTVTTDGSYTVVKYTSSGSYTA
jgi:hypothetical protein